jgi:hypothetical protein
MAHRILCGLIFRNFALLQQTKCQTAFGSFMSYRILWNAFFLCWIYFAFVHSAMACSATRVRYHFKNETVQASLSVRAGERCILTRRASSRSHFHVSAVTVQARNGTAQIIDSDSLSYTPRSGYKGSDRFVQRICGDGGESLQSTSCSNIEYLVTVD